VNYTIDIKDSNLIVHFYGELDHHITEKARNILDQRYMTNNLKNIIFDLTHLSFMDSSGIGLIMGRYKNCVERNGNVYIISDNVYIDRIIKMSGLQKIIKVYKTLDEAI